MAHFAEINQVSSPYLMLQYIGEVTSTRLVPRNCLRYLQTTLMMEGGDWSQNSREVLWLRAWIACLRFIYTVNS